MVTRGGCTAAAAGAEHGAEKGSQGLGDIGGAHRVEESGQRQAQQGARGQRCVLGTPRRAGVLPGRVQHHQPKALAAKPCGQSPPSAQFGRQTLSAEDAPFSPRRRGP